MHSSALQSQRLLKREISECESVVAKFACGTERKPGHLNIIGIFLLDIVILYHLGKSLVTPNYQDIKTV